MVRRQILRTLVRKDGPTYFVEIPSEIHTELGKPTCIIWYRKEGRRNKYEIRRGDSKGKNQGRTDFDAVTGPRERDENEFDAETKGSQIIISIVSLLSQEPWGFKNLQDRVPSPRKKEGTVSSATLDKYLKICRQQGLVRKSGKSQKAPYEITQKGRDYLQTVKTEAVENFVIEIVKGGSYDGSIIFRVPRSFCEIFNQLYKPKPLESLRRIFHVTLEFWVNRYREGIKMAWGRNFDRNDIQALFMWETQLSAYPEIYKKVQKDGLAVGLFQIALENLEFSLETGIYQHIRDQRFGFLLKMITELRANLSTQLGLKQKIQLVEQFFGKFTGEKMPKSLRGFLRNNIGD